MKHRAAAAMLAAFACAVMVGGCSAAKESKFPEADSPGITEEDDVLNQPPVGDGITGISPPVDEEPEIPEELPEEEEPTVKTVTYIRVTGDGVNIRSGAGTGYSVLGTAEKNTLYACNGSVNGWYKTSYKNKTAYISTKYCTPVEFTASDNEVIEAVIAEGTKLLGTPYVYGAVRLHDGKGTLLKGFTVNAFDCSSLMQYMFYYGADYLLDVNTRTQVYQGTTVTKANLQRGDLMFFTNDSRKNNTGVERIGHVAIYLGDNYILHTASDYAKIEQISAQRWNYFIQGQRIL